MFSFVHNSSNALIEIIILKNYIGIRDLFILSNNQTSVKKCFSEFNGSCTACRDGFALINNTCNSCGEGYYFENNTCLVCPISCKTCVKEDTEIKCTSCSIPLTLQDKFCVDTTGALFSSDIFENIPSSLHAPWKIYPRLQNNGIDSCNGKTILGSSSIKFKFLSMSRSFKNLPAHTGIIIFMHFYQIDDYAKDESVYFKLDDKKIIY